MDRYKALLVKQRDIMIALTARLNERDDSILGLQEELEAYDAHQKCALPSHCQPHGSSGIPERKHEDAFLEARASRTARRMSAAQYLTPRKSTQ